MTQIKKRHSWKEGFDYRVYDMRVVKAITGDREYKSKKGKPMGRSRPSEEYWRCNNCEIFMVPILGFSKKTEMMNYLTCPCCELRLSYGKRR